MDGAFDPAGRLRLRRSNRRRFDLNPDGGHLAVSVSRANAYAYADADALRSAISITKPIAGVQFPAPGWDGIEGHDH